MARDHRITQGRTTLLAVAATAALIGALPDTAAARSGGPVRVTPVSGRILVAEPGHRATRLRDARTVPFGSLVDAGDRGTVAIATSTKRTRSPATADVTGGRFRVTRPSRGLTRLSLVARAGERCRQATAATIYRPSMKVRVPSRHRRRHVRSTAAGVGDFESVGRYQTATNHGAAAWETNDSCVATTVSQDAGTVSTETHGPTSRPLRSLGPTSGSGASARRSSRVATTRKVWTVACSRAGQPPMTGGYCEALLAEELADGFVGYAPGLFAKSGAETFGLCISRPGAAQDCRTWPFSARDPDGFRDGLIACTAPRRGEYRFRWSVDGTPLDVQIPSYVASRGSRFNGPCSGRFGAPYSPLGRLPEPLPPNAQSVNRYLLPTAGALTSLSLFVIPTQTSGVETIQGVVYGDVGGAPGPLLGTTNGVAIKSSHDDGYQDLEFSPSLSLPAGAYWIGVLTHGTPNLVFARFEATAVEAYGASLVPGVPNDPFGPFTTKQRRMSLLVDYDAEP
jgi:hypothetical protein